MSTEDTRRLLCSLAWLRGLGGNEKLLGDVKFLVSFVYFLDAVGGLDLALVKL